MEADVAIQHGTVKWAAGESRYEQPEKVTYIYSSQKKGRKAQATSRFRVQSSKSYDNELEASVGRDTEEGSQSKVTNVHDDLSFRAGNRSERHKSNQEGKAVQPELQYTTHGGSQGAVMKERQTDSGVYNAERHGHKKSRWKPKLETKEATSHKARHRSRVDSEQVDLWVEEIQEQQAMVSSQESRKRPIHIEFHLKEDQLRMSEQASRYKRPINHLSELTSMSSPPSSSSREKPSSLIIVEVKDGPSFFYKPSDRMVSDSGISNQTMIPPHDCFPLGAARQAFSGLAEYSSVDPPRTTSFSAYTGSFSICNSENSPSSTFRRDSSTSLQHMNALSIGATMSSSEDSPKTRSTVSHFPRNQGLRKPDLSVLITPNKSKTNVLEDDIPHSIKDARNLEIPDNRDIMVQEPTLVAATLPITSTRTMPTHITVLQENTLQSAIPGKELEANVETRNSEQRSISENENPPSIQPQESITSPPPVPDFSLGFQNTYEVLQQMAGIKHDDIVVGPRRPKSGIISPDVIVEVSDNECSSRKCGSHESDTLCMALKLKQSASSDGLSVNHPVLLLDSGYIRQRNTNSESDFSSVVMPSSHLTSKYYDSNNGTLMSEERKDNCKSSNKTEQKCSRIEDLSTRRTTSKSKTDLGSDGAFCGVEGSKEWKHNEKKHHIQSIQQEESLTKDLSKIKATNLRIVPESDASYKTQSLDRLHNRTLDETVSKSASSTPAKQQLLGSKSKSSTSTPTKKLQINSKLHMLSNIPVPIGHDPPAKRHSYHRPPSMSDPSETIVPSAVEKVSGTANSDSLNGRSLLPNESEETTLASSTTPLLSCSSDQRLASLNGATSNIQASSFTQCDEHSQLVAPPVYSKTKPSIVSATNSHWEDFANTAKGHNLVGISSHSETSKDPLSTTTVENTNKPTERKTDSSCHLPVKPRLHRSTEHLLADTKLTAFNSAENVPFFDKSESSSSRTFQESAKSEKAGGDNISPLKKNHGLAKTGIIRRGSDRTDMYRRCSDRAVLSINQNDPSVEDLKKATSLKELCQSMASLLNIDNVRAAEMITTSLSQRQDLVEGLDADAILDYLSHHGVLDPGILVGLDDKATVTQRNSAILRHVEEHGNTAVALFINALRQSGQLHLASSLDTEQRIKPVTGNGYFGKDRHKGELTIRIEIESLKIVAPREPCSDKIVDTSLLGSPGRQTPDGVMVRDAADEEDYVKPRSCWCFCFSYKSKMKSMSKQDTEKQKKYGAPKQQRHQSPSPDKEFKPSDEGDKKYSNTKPHRTKSQEKTKKGKENLSKVTTTEHSKKDLNKTKDKKSKTSKSKVSGKYSTTNKTNVYAVDQTQEMVNLSGVPHQMDTDDTLTRESTFSQTTLGLRPTMLQDEPLTMKNQPYNGVSGTQTTANQRLRPEKETWDPIIMEYNPQLELVKLRAGQDELASPTRQSRNIGIMCEQWKSNGRHFQLKASQLCDKIIQELHTEIIKYFEQDRGTLVLDVVSDGSSILVVNICMMQTQVKCLQQEIADDSLLNKMQDMFFSKVNISEFDIRGVNLRIVLDQPELNNVLSELS